MTLKADTLAETAAFFDAKIDAFGATPEGLDWNGVTAQEARLRQVIKAVDRTSGFSINDVGCGYGHLASLLERDGYHDFDYTGYDIAPKMIDAAKQENAAPRRRFINGGITELEQADFTVASGVFNKLMGTPKQEWQDHVHSSLKAFFEASTQACSSNFLTAYSDPERMRDDLYYPDPRDIFDYCMSLTPWVTIHHDYGLYDFTVILRRL